MTYKSISSHFYIPGELVYAIQEKNNTYKVCTGVIVGVAKMPDLYHIILVNDKGNAEGLFTTTKIYDTYSNAATKIKTNNDLKKISVNLIDPLEGFDIHTSSSSKFDKDDSVLVFDEEDADIILTISNTNQ